MNFYKFVKSTISTPALLVNTNQKGSIIKRSEQDKNGIGQYTHENNLIKKFICKYDCIKQLKISDKTLRKALDNNSLYNNYYFKQIGSNLNCI